jgi:peptidoglycan-associated lipoprotein
MNHSQAGRSTILTLIVGVLFVSGCHKQVAKAPTVPPPTSKPEAPTVALQASPATITRGGSSTLTWSSSNVTQAILSPGVGSVATQGSTRVGPTDFTVYTITATGPGGTATASASIAVTAPYSAPTASSSAPTLEQLFQQSVKDAYFDYDKSDIRSDARDALTRDADFLRGHSDVRFTIEGHCDGRGGEEYNLALGDRRAASTKQFLVSLGISADRIQVVSFGKERPFCSSENEACYQQNRRGHFVLAQ